MDVALHCNNSIMYAFFLTPDTPERSLLEMPMFMSLVHKGNFISKNL